MKRIIVCDDDPECADHVKSLFNEYFESRPHNAEVMYYSCGEEFLTKYDHESPVDIAILDIMMGDLNGIQIGCEIQSRYPDAVLMFITSYPGYIDQAFDLHAFRYFSKPVDKDRLFRALDIKLKDKKTYIIENPSEVLSLSEDDIVYIAATRRKTEILTSSGNFIVSNLNKKKWQDKLNGNNTFSMPHGSFIVNLNYVRQITENYVVVECKNGKKEKIYSSKRFSSEFKKAFFKKMEEYK